MQSFNDMQINAYMGLYDTTFGSRNPSPQKIAMHVDRANHVAWNLSKDELLEFVKQLPELSIYQATFIEKGN